MRIAHLDHCNLIGFSWLMKSLSLKLSPLLIGSIILLFGFEARAHGGEDHGESQPQIAVTSTEVKHLARVGDLELLIKHAPIAPDRSAAAHVFLSRYATNEPVGGALITLRLAGQASAEVLAKGGRVSGQYELALPPLPQGSYRLSARVEVDGRSAEADLGALEVAPARASDAVGSGLQPSFVVVSLLIIIAASALLLFAWRVAGRRTKKEATAV